MFKCCTKYSALTNSAKTPSRYHYAIVKYRTIDNWSVLEVTNLPGL